MQNGDLLLSAFYTGCDNEKEERSFDGRLVADWRVRRQLANAINE